MIKFRRQRENDGKLLRRGSHDNRLAPARRDTRVRPCLEHLEDRMVPAAIDTTTNVAIAITPNLFGHTATETITATVTQLGSNTPVTSGNLNFNLNNQQGTVPLNSNGQATFSVSLPLFAVVNNQTLLASYGGATAGINTFESSAFLSPVYLNMLNGVFASQITFGTPPTPTPPTTPFNSASGEKDAITLLFLPVDFNYIDPGRIDTIDIGGFTIPGAFATVFGIQQLG